LHVTSLGIVNFSAQMGWSNIEWFEATLPTGPLQMVALDDITFSPASVPEPASGTLAVLALSLGICYARSRPRRSN
jgi:hypothetical protein